MTIYNKFISMLIDIGMSNTQAKEVMKLAIPKLRIITENHHISFDASVDSYPEVIYNILFATIKEVGLEWLEEHKPQAWFKPMFEGSSLKNTIFNNVKP